MTFGPELFGALVRAIGLYWFTYGMSMLPGVLFPGEKASPQEYAIVGGAQMILGLFLLLKADGVVSSCYADSKPSHDDS